MDEGVNVPSDALLLGNAAFPHHLIPGEGFSQHVSQKDVLRRKLPGVLEAPVLV